MSLIELLLIAVSLSMDAFAVSVCKGLAMKKIKIRDSIAVGLWFGGFQGLMPVIGYLLGVQFQNKIEAVDHWIAFVLLSLIGANMIRESLSKEEESTDASVNFKGMFVLALATSIDALAIGVTFAFLQVQIIPAVATIGINHLPALPGRRQGRQCLRHALQSQSRICRRRRPDSTGPEDSPSAPWHHQLLKKAGIHLKYLFKA